MRRVAPLTVAVVSACAMALVACGDDSASSDDANVFAERGLFDPPDTRLSAAAAQAEADGDTAQSDLLTRLAAVPTAVWLTPEAFPAGEVGSAVRETVAAAQEADERVPVFVVYGIPDRDCTGQLSAGGLPADEYLPWVGEIAAAAGPSSVAVLEPDALPGVMECDGGDQRVELLQQAIGTLDDAGVVTYVDAAHSDWRSPAEMADLLERVGVDRVRGFATNVSNYQPLSAETAYAERISALLDGEHFVIDTGRNGAPGGVEQPVDDWCNPPGRALGQEPGFVDDGSGLDALLWIKPPAESDGTCAGGPPAGEVWLDRAEELATAAGW